MTAQDKRFLLPPERRGNNADRRLNPKTPDAEKVAGNIPTENAGLYLIQQTSGAMSWALRYRVAGASRKLTIGPCPPIGLAAARRRATEALGEIAGGKDPAAAKQASKAKAKAEREADVDRVDRVVALFVERHAKPKTRTWRKVERTLGREVAERWKGRRLSQITRAHVHDMLDEIVDRGAPIQAARALRPISHDVPLGGRTGNHRAQPVRGHEGAVRRNAPGPRPVG